MLVDVQQSQIYNSLKEQSNLAWDKIKSLKYHRNTFFAYQVTIYLICSHKVYLQGAQDTYNWVYQQPRHSKSSTKTFYQQS